jgi:hypothetical protein
MSSYYPTRQQEVLTAPERDLTQQQGYMQRLGAFTGAARVKRLALKLMVAAAVTTPGVLQSSELTRLKVSGSSGLGVVFGVVWGGVCCGVIGTLCPLPCLLCCVLMH